MSAALSAFRDRKVLFGVLLLVLAANAVVLVSYRTFYDERLRALVAEEDALAKRRDEARRRADAAVASERHLFETQEALTAFFTETLGGRKERIASLIEEIYAMTREAGLRPDTISYSSVSEPGRDSLTMSFGVAGPYTNVKRLLAALERSRRFLVVEQLGIAGGSQEDPNAVNVAFTVTNYFRPTSLRPIRPVAAASGKTRPLAARKAEAAR